MRILAPGLLAERTVDGDNYIRTCDRHAWAALETYSIDDTAHYQCPKCTTREFERGHARWLRLQLRLTTQG